MSDNPTEWTLVADGGKFLRWYQKIEAEDAKSAAAIEAAIAALEPVRRIIVQREAERAAAAAEDKDSPWHPVDHIQPSLDAAVAAIYTLAEAYAEAYAADMPERIES